MKKILIAVLAVFMVLSLVACDQTDKVYETHAEFVKYSDINTCVDNLFKVIVSLYHGGDSDLSERTLIPAKVATLWSEINPLANENYNYNVTVSEKSGKVSITYTDENNYSVTLNNVVISFSYDIVSGEQNIETNKIAQITLDGTYSSSLKDNIITVNGKVKVNSISYEISYALNTVKSQLTYAKVNGKKVDVRFLNAILPDVSKKSK